MPIIACAYSNGIHSSPARHLEAAAATTRRVVANRKTQTQSVRSPKFTQQDLIVVGTRIARCPKPLPLGYLLHFPISILVHIFWLATRGDRSAISSLSTVSKLFYEACKPLQPPKFTLNRSKRIMEPDSDLKASLEDYRQLINLPDMVHIQTLQNEYPSKRVAYLERLRYGRPYSLPQPQTGRVMCDRETCVEPEDREVPSWATASTDIIRRPQPPPQGYLLDYPVDLLTRILSLVCNDRPDAGRSLCLVSKGFYAAVKPVMLSRVRLWRVHQVLGLAHIISVDPIAKAGIRTLYISIGGREMVLLGERNWDTVESMGNFHWDASYWGDPDAEYIDERDSSDESEDSHDSGEEADLEQDMAFLTSPEGAANTQSSGETKRWPVDINIEKARALVDKAMSEIIHTVAPFLRMLKLTSDDHQLGITLPVFPKLSELTIHLTQLPALKAHEYPLFPAMKTLWIRGKAETGHIDLDNLILHAPTITIIRVAFGKDRLRALFGKLSVLSPPNSDHGEKRMFECVEQVYIAHDDKVDFDDLFEPDEALYETWDSVACFGAYDIHEH